MNRSREVIHYLKYGEYGAEAQTGIIIGLTIMVCLILVALTKRTFKKEKYNKSLHHKLSRGLIISVIYLLGLTVIISQIPSLHNLASTILAGSGILALTVSLAAQESLGNVLSGIFITVFKPFDTGDRVKLVDQNITGVVEDITFRHTVIRTFINTRLVVPNSVMNSAVIENSNYEDDRASAFLDLVISYDSDIDMAKEIMADIIENHPLFIDTRSQEQKDSDEPKVEVFIRELSHQGIHLRASVWTASVGDNFKTCSDCRYSILKRFAEANIKLPYSRVTIDYANGGSCDAESQSN